MFDADLASGLSSLFGSLLASRQRISRVYRKLQLLTESESVVLEESTVSGRVVLELARGGGLGKEEVLDGRGRRGRKRVEEGMSTWRGDWRRQAMVRLKDL